MGYTGNVGRVGALAVALGVGMAVATNAGVALAEPSSDSAASSGDASSSPTSGAASSAGTSSGTSATASTSAGASSSGASSDTDNDEHETERGAAGVARTGAAGHATDDTTADTSDGTDDAVEVPADADATDDSASGGSDYHAVAAPEPKAKKNAAPPPSDTATVQRVASLAAPDTDPPAAVDEQPAAPAVVADIVEQPSADRVFAHFATALQSVAPAPTPAKQKPPTLVGAVTEFVSAVLSPLLGGAQHGPIQIPILTAALSLVRNEFEKFLTPRQTVAAQQTTSVVSSLQALPLDQQHVLVIGIDGANLSRILALPNAADKDNFLELLGTSTSAAPSIVGHTTISDPSWTSILTGAWGERTGVINNVFTPWTYDRYATMFDQIESLNEDIDTTVIADWNVINAIGAAGAGGADNNLYVTQIAGDTNWLDTDDLVAQLTVDAINAQDHNDPNLLFSYFVGVDENGHLYGGASPEYQAALVNMNDNLGLMMDAVAAREMATGEDWTIIVVTDHGHQPQKGFGHGFNSPAETATFVIVDGPGFADGNINTAYQIVDTTPTVLQIFGGGVPPRTDGVPLQSLGAGTHYATIEDLVAGLNAEIAAITSPNIVTDAALTLRTVFATIPYFIYDFGLTGGLGLPSFLALPAQLLFSGLYVATNVPAQIVAFGTGVYGARIFPILPPPAPNFTPVNPHPTPLAPAPIAV